MLSQQEAEAFAQSAAQIKQKILSHLGPQPSAVRVISFVSSLHQSADHMVHSCAQRQATACQPGCAYCCSARVEVREAEVFHLLAEIHRWPLARQSSLLQALQQRAAACSGRTAQGVHCVFLHQQQCSIYPHRPSACRKAHSLDSECCKSQAATVPQDLPLVLGIEAMQKGFADACSQLGLSHGAVELNAAILLVLQDAGAEARWSGGEDVFAAIRG